MIKDIKISIKTLLENAIAEEIDAQLQIPVEIPTSIEQYKLSHPIGAYLIVYKGETFKSREMLNILAQNRDIEIMIVVVARNIYGMSPEDYLDFAIDTLSGCEIDTKRTDRKIFFSQDEWLGEEAGVWVYAATLIVPATFIK